MFYYPTVLKRHSGCFSTIWLVATKGIKIPRRDFLKVNVMSTCDDIMSYVLQRVPPPQPGLPRPRFSLYLSSQLQYGVILVYHRQCALLLQELQSVVVKMLKQRVSQKIDMDEPSRHALDFPDALSLMEDTEGALDPLFGVMFMREAMPSPNTLIQMGREYQREWSPELPAAAEEQNSAITASPETITLREKEPIAIPPAEFEGMELVDQHPDTIDILMAQTGHFPEDQDFDILEPGAQEREIERDGREEDLEGKTTRDFTASTIDLQHPTLSTEEVILPQEDPGLSVEIPRSPSDLHTPASVSIFPSPPHAAEKRQRPALQLKDVPTPEVPMRRRKRQLIFFDPETQIPEQVQQEQIDDPHIETRPPPTLQPPSQRLPSAAELFNNPCTPLPEELLLLWKQAATITPLSGSDLEVGERGPESTDSEKERERDMVEAAEEVEAREGKDGGAALSPRESPRDVAELEMCEFSDPDTLMLERSDQRESFQIVSPMFSSEKERPAVPRSLKDIPEVVDEFLERAAAESPGLPFDFPENEEGHVVFASLLPPDANRRTVSKSFMRLLESLTAKRVRAEQDEPYGDILIFPGPNYEEQRQTL